MVDHPSLAEFRAAAERFLADRYPRRVTDESQTVSEPFTWGAGSDEVRVFQEPDPDEEAEALPAIRAWRAELWDNGYGWICGPPEFGGAGLPGAYERAFQQLTRAFDVPGDASLTISLGMIAPTLLAHGNDEQKARYLPRLYRGDLIACQLFSEPGAGSDLASLRTKAVRDAGDDGQGGWRITGQKVWTSGAHLADVGEIICRTAEGPRHHNLTAFLVDMHAPGVTVRPLRQMTGGAAFNEVFLDNVAVPERDRVDEEGRGWPVALTTLSHERNAMGHSAFGGVGLLSTERLRHLVRHFGLADDPVVRQAFGELIMELRVARYRQQVLAARARAGARPGNEVALNKLALSANMARLGEFVAQVLGPRVSPTRGSGAPSHGRRCCSELRATGWAAAPTRS